MAQVSIREAMERRDAYLRRKGWTQSSTSVWLDPRDGWPTVVEVAHLLAKQRRGR